MERHDFYQSVEQQANLGDEADALGARLEEFGYDAIIPESGPGADAGS